jgi:peptide/nickel transport system permease protein
MGFKFVLLWTDVALWLLAAAVVAYGLHVRGSASLRATWRRVLRDPAAVSAAVVLGVFVVIALLDSLHFRRALPTSASASPSTPATQVFYDTRTESLLDLVLHAPIAMREASYSQPLATHGLIKETREVDGRVVREYPRLDHAGKHLQDPTHDWGADVARRVLVGVVGGALMAALIACLAAWGLRGAHGSTAAAWRAVVHDETDAPVRAALLTVLLLAVLIGPTVALMGYYHVLGTNQTGTDVLVLALKSIRTAFVIGALSTVATLPFALVFGLLAGYFGGWVDELIQYLYTVLSSVPNVLLIAACVLMVQVFLDKNPDLFETGLERADLKLLLLCLILGLTGWATLCRLIRGETLKLRELEYVQAAQAFGVRSTTIMAKHLLPNVMHLVLITTVLSFSELILYEAVLTYVGVGVDGQSSSFGTMINLARNEMGRDPLVWWSFAAAFAFMVALVLAANLVADGIRDAFDPKARSLRPQRLSALTRVLAAPSSGKRGQP